MTELASLYRETDAVGLARLVKKGDVTAAELLHAALDRVNETQPLLNFMGIPMANGGVVDSGGVQAFAKGGAFTDQVFSAPTPFQFAAGGGFGLVVMGRRGLKR